MPSQRDLQDLIDRIDRMGDRVSDYITRSAMPDRIEVLFETRDAKIEGNRLVGTVHSYGTRAMVRGSYEEFAPGAFSKVLADPASDVRAFYNHDTSLILGRQSNGTVELRDTAEGLQYSIELPDTSYAADVKALANRGDLGGMSFGFIPGKVTTSRASDGTQVRTHTEVRSLIEISPVTLPAYRAGTSVALRSHEVYEPPKSQAIKARQRARSNNR